MVPGSLNKVYCDKVSLGLGLNYQTIDAKMTSAVAGRLAYSKLNGDDGAWGWNAGALFTLSPAMRVGVSYRSAINYTLDGTASTAVSSTPVKADLKLPGTFILSVWQQVSDKWEAMGDLSYTQWNTLNSLNVVSRNTGVQLSSEAFDYDNAWRIAWGAAYKANDAWKLKFGIAWDTTPTNNQNLGSHGGGQAEGHRGILEGYGMTEEFLGCPIHSSMETVIVCQAAEGFPVHFDKQAFGADHVVVVGRVKPHTSFVGEIESGLMKMMLIGLGKHEGAKIYHRAILDYSFGQIVRSVARDVLSRCRIVAGVGIVENGSDETAKIAAVAPAEFEERKRAAAARQTMVAQAAVQDRSASRFNSGSSAQ